jgi:hypothetical protein
MNLLDICGETKIIKGVTGFFTSEDIVKLNEYFTENENRYSLKGLVQYFDSKLGCNRVVKLLNDVIQRGIKITPNIVFHPVTEKRVIENGVFTLTNKPYFMDDSIFINNLIVVKLLDGTYKFYDDVEFDLVSLKCNLGEEALSGTATVSYFVLDTEFIGGLDALT